MWHFYFHNSVAVDRPSSRPTRTAAGSRRVRASRRPSGTAWAVAMDWPRSQESVARSMAQWGPVTGLRRVRALARGCSLVPEPVWGWPLRMGSVGRLRGAWARPMGWPLRAGLRLVFGCLWGPVMASLRRRRPVVQFGVLLATVLAWQSVWGRVKAKPLPAKWSSSPSQWASGLANA